MKQLILVVLFLAVKTLYAEPAERVSYACPFETGDMLAIQWPEEDPEGLFDFHGQDFLVFSLCRALEKLHEVFPPEEFQVPLHVSLSQHIKSHYDDSKKALVVSDEVFAEPECAARLLASELLTLFPVTQEKEEALASLELGCEPEVKPDHIWTLGQIRTADGERIGLNGKVTLEAFITDEKVSFVHKAEGFWPNFTKEEFKDLNENCTLDGESRFDLDGLDASTWTGHLTVWDQKQDYQFKSSSRERNFSCEIGQAEVKDLLTSILLLTDSTAESFSLPVVYKKMPKNEYLLVKVSGKLRLIYTKHKL